MERPLFVLDDDWRFRYVNPAGAALLGRTVDGLVGRVVWEEFPQALDSPFELNYRRGRGDRRTGQLRGLVRPAGDGGSRSMRSAPRAGLVVTYDDVTQRRRAERSAPPPSRPRARRRPGRGCGGGRGGDRAAHELLGDINLAMTSTFDTDEAVDRVRPPRRPPARRLVPGERGGPRRQPPGRRPRAPRPRPGRRDAPVRRPAGGFEPPRRPRAPAAARAHGPWSSPSCTPALVEADGRRRARGRAALEPLQARAARGLPARRAGEALRGRFTAGQRPRARGRTPRPSCGRRRSPPAARRSR
jgi:hypothetical protein